MPNYDGKIHKYITDEVNIVNPLRHHHHTAIEIYFRYFRSNAFQNLSEKSIQDIIHIGILPTKTKKNASIIDISGVDLKTDTLLCAVLQQQNARSNFTHLIIFSG